MAVGGVLRPVDSSDLSKVSLWIFELKKAPWQFDGV
jgi:hypothetical protein